MGCCEDKQIQNQSQLQRIITPSTLVRAFPNELKQTKDNSNNTVAHPQNTIQTYELYDHSQHHPSNRQRITGQVPGDFKMGSNDFINQNYPPKREDIMMMPHQLVNQIKPQPTQDRTSLNQIPYPRQLNFGSLWTIQQQNSSLNNTNRFSTKYPQSSGLQSPEYQSSINRIMG